MKKVNFITSLSPQKQYAIARWFWVTFFLFVCAMVVSVYFVVPQLLIYISLKKEVSALREATKGYGNVVKNKDALTTEHDTLRMRIKKIENYNDAPKNPHQYIAAIVQACGDGATLQAVRFNKKSCELTLLCPTPEHATVFIKRLSASELFAGLKLVSLQHEGAGKQFRCVVKSVVNKV
jgi:hypothetical protein